MQRIGARQIEHKLRLELGNPFQCAAEGAQIGLILGAIRQADIERRWHLAEREVLLAVHAEDEHVRPVAENGGIAVALVHIEVDDGDTPHETLCQ